MTEKAYTGEVTDELKEIYRQAWEEGIWLKEFGCPVGGQYWMAAAGEIRVLEKIEQRIGREIDIEKDLSLGDCVELACPGTGKTREEACRKAIEALRSHLAEKEKNHCRGCDKRDGCPDRPKKPSVKKRRQRKGDKKKRET